MRVSFDATRVQEWNKLRENSIILYTLATRPVRCDWRKLANTTFLADDSALKYLHFNGPLNR